MSLIYYAYSILSTKAVGLGHPQAINGAKNSRMDQVKFVQDSL